jgi:hypothetical protein
MQRYAARIVEEKKTSFAEHLRHFSDTGLAAGFNTGSGGSSVANELLMVVRKQV